MALRVTQGIMYQSMVGGMNRNLSALMESNLQASSQLRINRPSDDPVGAGRVISYNASLYNIGTYQDNVKQATGWLNTADAALAGDGSVQSILTRIKTLAQQAATGTYDGTNREQISYEVRQQYQQLINLANSTFEGRHIFAGHKTDQPAYVQTLGVTCRNQAFNAEVENSGVTLTAEGGADYSVIVQFTSTGQLGTGSTYRYSPDGGKTWFDSGALSSDTITQEGDDFVLHAGGASIRFNNAVTSPVNVTAVQDADKGKEDPAAGGTWLYIRPTAQYKGDDNDTQVMVPYGSGITGTASGYFTRDVAVRIDGDDGSKLTYSYSLDDGSNWTQVTAPSGSTELPVPGGYLNLSAAPGAVNVGEQFTIHPHRADINFDIGPSDTITVNLVGKEIFGGLYLDPKTGEIIKADNATGDNLFETVGDLLAALETNSQSGVQECLEKMTGLMNVVLTKAAMIGGRENRLQVTSAALTMRKLDETENLSNVEDVDVTELMTRLAQQQVAYNSVLKSSSMVMQMSLVNFL